MRMGPKLYPVSFVLRSFIGQTDALACVPKQGRELQRASPARIVRTILVARETTSQLGQILKYLVIYISISNQK